MEELSFQGEGGKEGIELPFNVENKKIKGKKKFSKGF